MKTEKTEKRNFELTRQYSNDNQIIEAVAEQLRGTDYKAIAVISAEVKKQLYCMTEQDFIKYAVKYEERKSSIKKGENYV